MTYHGTEHLLEQLAQTLPEGSISLDGLLAEAKTARKRHTRRKRLVVGCTAVAALAVVAVSVASPSNDAGQGFEVATDGTRTPDSPAATSSASDNALTTPRLTAARRVLFTYMDDNPDATVDTAWARFERGTVKQPNLGDCTSGELLRVDIFGAFPNIVTSGVFDPNSATAMDGLDETEESSTGTTDFDPLGGTVTEVRLVADAQTQEVCQLSVVTGTHDPDPQNQQIYPETVSEVPAFSGDDTEAPVSLDGTYRVTALVGPGGGSLLEGSYAKQLEMTFDEGRMNGTSGCNDIGADYTSDGRDLRFDATTMFSTTVGCEEPPLAERLLAVRHVSRDGDKIHLHAENWMIVVELRTGSRQSRGPAAWIYGDQ